MRYTSDAETRDALGLPDWRHLRKEHVLQLMSMLSDSDSRVALNILGQLPDVTSLARVAMDGLAKGYDADDDAALSSNSRSMEMVHEVHVARLELLKDELKKDLSADERLLVVNEIRDVHAGAQAKDTENKQFLSDQFDKTVTSTVAGAVALVAVMLGAAMAGSKKPVFEP